MYYYIPFCMYHCFFDFMLLHTYTPAYMWKGMYYMQRRQYSPVPPRGPIEVIPFQDKHYQPFRDIHKTIISTRN